MPSGFADNPWAVTKYTWLWSLAYRNNSLFTKSYSVQLKPKESTYNKSVRKRLIEWQERFEKDNPDSWLSTDTQEVKKFSQDRYSGFPFTVCAMHDLIKLNSLCNKPIWSQAISKELPIFIISGKDDPVGDYGRGVLTVYNRLKKAGCNVSVKLYPGARHELLNEFCKDEVISDILNFISKN